MQLWVRGPGCCAVPYHGLMHAARRQLRKAARPPAESSPTVRAAPEGPQRRVFSGSSRFQQ
eukprot:6861891-Alexandrium_andersonii.AAC.1